MLGLGCATAFDQGSALYREGDLRGALDVWRSIGPDDGDHSSAQQQISLVEAEFERLLRRYEKRGQFYEGEGRLAEALLSYRLALKLDTDRPALLDRVQTLVRELDQRQSEALRIMSTALDQRELTQAGAKARELERLNPFSPGLQVEIRQVEAALGEQVLRFSETGTASYKKGFFEEAREQFQQVLALDPGNETALGYLSYIADRSSPAQSSREAREVPPPLLSQAEILAEGHFRAGGQAADAGNPYRALEQYDEAVRLNPSHPSAGLARNRLRERLTGQIPDLEARAKRYFQEEDLQNAVLMWKRVLLISPEQESAAYNLARAERMLAKLEELQASGSGG